MLKFLIDLFRRKPAATEPQAQVGAIPYRLQGGELVFLLVTSRRSGRWIFPKGGRMQGRTDWDAAAIEAFEEAGVQGHVDPVPVGCYRAIGRDRRPLEVTLYPLLVDKEHDHWPEKGARFRHWATSREARRLIGNREIAALTTRLAARLAGDEEPQRLTGSD